MVIESAFEFNSMAVRNQSTMICWIYLIQSHSLTFIASQRLSEVSGGMADFTSVSVTENEGISVRLCFDGLIKLTFNCFRRIFLSPHRYGFVHSAHV